MSEYKKFDRKDPEERREIIRRVMDIYDREEGDVRNIIYEECLKHFDPKGIIIGSTFYFRGTKTCLN